MNDINNISEHIDYVSQWRGWESTTRRKTGIDRDMTEKGNKKGNNPVQIIDFSQTPPGGGGTEGVVRWRTPLPLQPISRITNASKNCDLRNKSLRSNTNERAL